MSTIKATTFSAPRPIRFTLFLRTFALWQIVRFILINIRMTVMILKSHGGRSQHGG
jgi:hypothetical protein